MRIVRALYPAIVVAVLLAIAVVVFSHEHSNVETPRTLSRSKSPTQTAASTGDRSSTATGSARSFPSSVAANSPPAMLSVESEAPIPTELPDSPRLEARLSRNGNDPDWREGYTYQLGLMAFYEKCMKGRIEHGVIYYYLKWQVDEDHLASSPVFQFADVPPEGSVSEDDKLAFAACVNAYLVTHDQAYLPHALQNAAWGMGAIFPVRDSTLLRLIADAKRDSDSGNLGSGSALHDGAAKQR
jgi:hypothetical protein